MSIRIGMVVDPAVITGINCVSRGLFKEITCKIDDKATHIMLDKPSRREVLVSYSSYQAATHNFLPKGGEFDSCFGSLPIEVMHYLFGHFLDLKSIANLSITSKQIYSNIWKNAEQWNRDFSGFDPLDKYGKNSSWDSVTNSLPDKEPRYVIYRPSPEETGPIENKDIVLPKKKYILLLWCPDDSQLKKRMIYTSSIGEIKRAAKRNLTGSIILFEAQDKQIFGEQPLQEIIRSNNKLK
eukprot:TRINITY_DN12143_c0_g1_i1.p1 TRINITY_DN12143_c0_g1~~TRINITY_DN12143_c0_g1_i1.p1  ORF type:complete len:239 (-),score=42.81 TRINITY_DN12143_c0_g1_i1:110-826(-)